jgi:hypothetical protein
MEAGHLYAGYCYVIDHFPKCVLFTAVYIYTGSADVLKTSQNRGIQARETNSGLHINKSLF